jgi:hypothetical protein
MGQIIEVYEEHKGLHGGNYYFIIENRKLVHISQYALSMKKNIFTYYYINLDDIKDKKVIEVSSTNQGIFDVVWLFPAEDLSLEWNRRRIQKLPITIINEYELTHIGTKERLFLSEWNRYYKPMLNYIRREVIEKGGYVGVSDLIKVHLNNDLKYPVSFLIPYSENARFMSLTGLTKQIHQIWLTIRILREFTSGILKLYFEQSSSIPLAIIDKYSMWYEFDLNPHTMFKGILWYKSDIPLEMKKIFERAEEVRKKYNINHFTLRPDIVFTYASNAKDFMENPIIKLIIECKNFDYTFWEKDVEKQVKPYVEIFNPEHMVIASLKPVPQYSKQKLFNYGIDVIDNVYPEGNGEYELMTYIKQVLI